MKRSGEFSASTSLNDIKEKIKDRADIGFYIGKHTKLVKSTQGFKACCPLPGHKEKTPSFYVNTRDNYFYCYGCNRGGDIFSFLKLVEGLEFIEALKELAQDLNIDLPAIGSGSAQMVSSPQAQLQKSRREKGYELLNRAALFFNRVLMDQVSPGAAKAYAYLRQRGLSDNEMMDWMLGWAPEGSGTLLKRMKDPEEIEIAKGVGLIRQYESRAYDFFQDRLMIPIRDARGRTVAFSGRSLLPVADGNPKYKNSPETEWFKKKETLYGLDRTAKVIRDENYVCFVEGYFDQWAFQRKGIPAVAVMGTALSAEHLQLIGKHTQQIVLVMDTDQAGINSTRRSLPLFLEKSFDVKIFSEMAGKDPDEWLQSVNENSAQIRSRLLGAPEALDWWGRLVVKESAEQNYNRLQTLKALVEVWAMARTLAHKSVLADEWGRLLNLSPRNLMASLDEITPRNSGSHGQNSWGSYAPNEASYNRIAKTPKTQLERHTEEAFVFWLQHWETLVPKSHEAWDERERLFRGTRAEKFIAQLGAQYRLNHGELNRDYIRGCLDSGGIDDDLRPWILKGLVSSELALPEDVTKILNSFGELSSVLERERVNAEFLRLQSELRSSSQDPEKTAQLLQAVQELRMNLEKRK